MMIQQKLLLHTVWWAFYDMQRPRQAARTHLHDPDFTCRPWLDAMWAQALGCQHPSCWVAALAIDCLLPPGNCLLQGLQPETLRCDC